MRCLAGGRAVSRVDGLNNSSSLNNQVFKAHAGHIDRKFMLNVSNEPRRHTQHTCLHETYTKNSERILGLWTCAGRTEGLGVELMILLQEPKEHLRPVEGGPGVAELGAIGGRADVAA